MAGELPTTKLEREVVTAYLERDRPTWLDARDAAQRAGGMSAALNELEAKAMARVDYLLEELHALGGTALAQVIELPQRETPPDIVA